MKYSSRMEKSVTLVDSDLEDIYDVVFNFWNNLAGDEGASNVEDIYNQGVEPRPADRYLWNLGMEDTFTYNEIDNLERHEQIIRAANYPQDLKDAISLLLSKLKREQKNQQRNQISNVVRKKARNLAISNVYEKATGQSATPGHGPVNIIREMSGFKRPKRSMGGRSMGGRRTRKSKVRKTRKNLRK